MSTVSTPLSRAVELAGGGQSLELLRALTRDAGVLRVVASWLHGSRFVDALGRVWHFRKHSLQGFDTLNGRKATNMTAMTLYRKRCYTHVLGFLLHLGFGDTAVHKVTFDAVVRALLARELVHCCDTSRRKHRRKCAAAAAGVATGEVPMRQPEAASTLSADIVPLEGPVTAEDWNWPGLDECPFTF